MPFAPDPPLSVPSLAAPFSNGADQTLRRLPSTAADEAADGSDSDIPDLVSFSDDDEVEEG